MSVRVTVRPSGREFQVEGKESLLQAALRAGLLPAYGCGSGICGECKVRIVSGEVRQTQHIDYSLSEAEKAQNYMLMCSHTAATDLVIDVLEADSPADIPEQQLVAKVRSVVPLDAQTMLLHLRTQRSESLRFFAGQSATLGIAGSTTDCGGEYPIASCPCDAHNLLFHIPRDTGEGDDKFSQRLFAGAIRPGDPVNVRGPAGTFVLKKDSARSILFACCDTGFAPINSLIEHALSVDAAGSIALCWAVTRPDGHYAANLCRAWTDALDDFHYLPCVATAASGAAAGARAATALLEAVASLPDLTARDVYVAGPETFVGAVMAALQQTGIPAAQLAATAI